MRERAAGGLFGIGSLSGIALQHELHLSEPAAEAVVEFIGVGEEVEDGFDGKGDRNVFRADECAGSKNLPEGQFDVVLGRTGQIPDGEYVGADQTESYGQREVLQRSEEEEDQEQAHRLPEKVGERRGGEHAGTDGDKERPDDESDDDDNRGFGGGTKIFARKDKGAERADCAAGDAEGDDERSW